jgi:hypothetical protein
MTFYHVVTMLNEYLADHSNYRNRDISIHTKVLQMKQNWAVYCMEDHIVAISIFSKDVPPLQKIL